jgi:CubicO group peptidase (beta-lactamase class C family)
MNEETNQKKSCYIMKKINFIIVLILLVRFGYAQNVKKDYTDAFNLIEVWLEAQKDFEKLPGITAIVVEDQQVLWKGGFGFANLEKEIKADPSSLFSICSISKLFTSIAIMQLYEEGKLRLDDRVSDILPFYDLTQKYEDSGPITIRTLLTHSSGLPREAAYPYWTGPDFPFPTLDQIISGLEGQETLYPSSTYWQYSNLGLTLLGLIIEEVSGLTYDDYISQKILNPLDLNNTRTELPESLYGDQLCIGYSSIKRSGERDKMNFFQANGIKAAAGFSSNVEDLAKFASWQFQLYDTSDVAILKPSTLKYMHKVHWIDPDWETTWGLGFKVKKGMDDEIEVGHGGSCPGYRSGLSIYPKEKRAYVVMINASGTNPQKYINGIMDIMSEVKNPEGDDDSKENSVNFDFKDYIGYYSGQPWVSEVYVGEWQEKLVLLTLPSDDPKESMILFKPISKDTFQRIREDKELGETLKFERDENKQVIKFKRHGNYSTKIMEP